MKNRVFSTEKLAAGIKALIKAAGLKDYEVYGDIHMSPSYFHKVLNCEQTI